MLDFSLSYATGCLFLCLLTGSVSTLIAAGYLIKKEENQAVRCAKCAKCGKFMSKMSKMSKK
jgi:hypothetical protein